MNLPIDNPMEKLPEIYSKVSAVVDLAKSLFTTDHSIKLPRALAQYVSELNSNVVIFSNLGIVDGIEKFENALRISNNIGIYATALGQQGPALLKNSLVTAELNALYTAGTELTNFIGNIQVSTSGIIAAGVGPMLPDMALQKNWKELDKQFTELTHKLQAKLEVAEGELGRHELRVQAFSDLLDTNWQKLESATSEISQRIKLSVSTAEEMVARQSDVLAEQYNATIQHLKAQEQEVAKSLGSFASSLLAGGYARSAENEQKSANIFRNISVALMVAVALILASTLYEIGSNGLGWKEAALRLVISLLLSVPVGYLARESSRHRGQHYNHLQTALDFAAVGPFIESLPPEAREKIKFAMAQRLFYQNLREEKVIDNYGLDIQALIIKFMDKIEIPKTKS